MSGGDKNNLRPKQPEDPDDRVVLSARQTALRNYLERSKPGLGAIYYGVHYALSVFRNPENITQAAHSARELIQQLHQAFPDIPSYDSQGRAYEKVAELSTLYQLNPTDKELRDKVADLDKFYRDSQMSRRQRLTAIIETINQGRSPSDEDKNRAAKALDEYRIWLSKIAHHGENVSQDEFRRRLDWFETILEILISGYFDVERHVRQLMDEPAPSSDDLQQLQQLFLRASVTEFFFRNASNAAWLPVLSEAGYFTKPIDIVVHPDGAVSCPSWPQSVYLTRCASTNPQLVADIINKVEDTANARVHQELVEVALKLPSELISSFSKKAKNWIRDRYHSITLLPTRLGELAVKLAAENQINVAFEVADTILDVWLDEKRYEQLKKSTGFDLPPDAEAFVEDWNYNRLLGAVSLLCEKDPIRFLRLLCNKLSKTIRLEHKARGNPDETTDYTYITRPAIEENEQNRGTDRLKDNLINHLRDASVQFVRNDTPMAQILRTLREQKYPVFRRIELHLLTKFPDICAEEIESWLLKKEHFNDVPIHHEFYLLLNRAFGLVRTETQQIYLDWVAAGPDLDFYKKQVEKETGNPPSDEQVRAYSARWRLRRYTPVAPFLTGSHKEVYDKLVESVQIEDHPEFVTFSKSWVGPTSPMDEKQLGEMEVKDVLSYLSSWQPPKEHYAPSPEGLGRFIKDDVRARASEYSSLVDTIDIYRIRPVYLYYLFSGLEDGVKDSKPLEWTRVLSLANAIVLASNLPEPEKLVDHFETGWSGVRKEIASLLSEALRRHKIVPYELRESVWRILEPLCRDSEPSLDYEAQYGGSNMSPVDMSINTVRGEATHAFFQYLLWVDQYINDGRKPENHTHSIPDEARPLLARLLDPAQEPTLTVRSVVAWYLSYLAFLDLNWTKAQMDSIFPDKVEHHALRDAAFEGYFSFNQPNGYLFRNLRPLFDNAFNWANAEESSSSFHRPRQSYVDHLLHFYWWGIDPLDNEHCLIRKMFESGNAKLRVYAIKSAGRSLETLLPVAPGGSEALNRLQQLLDWRVGRIPSARLPDNEVIDELKEFGWWFTNAQMDHRWLLDKLCDILYLTKGRVEWTHKVLERLTEFISMDSLAVAQAADKIVRSDASPWNLDYWQEQLRQLFEGVKKTGNHDAWVMCVATINFLGEKGFRSFRDLL
jgi:hypothetical protein